MNMVPTSAAAAHPRPPPPPGPRSAPISGHSHNTPHHPVSHQAAMNHSAPYGHSHHSHNHHQPQQQGHSMGPGGVYPPMASQSPSPRGVPQGIPPGSAHSHTPGSVSGAPSPFHHPLHSPAAGNVNVNGPHPPHHPHGHGHAQHHGHPSSRPHHNHNMSSHNHPPPPPQQLSHHPQMHPSHSHGQGHHPNMGGPQSQPPSQPPSASQPPQQPLSGVNGGPPPAPHPSHNYNRHPHPHYGQIPPSHGNGSTNTSAGGSSAGTPGGGPSSSSHPSQHQPQSSTGASVTNGVNGGPARRSSASSIGSGSQQQQLSYLPTKLNGEWQSDNDMKHRRNMIQNIVKLLKQKDKNSSPEWHNKLPQMVKQLEVSLYRSAPSFEAYSDESTLKKRLQALAFEISKKTQGGGGSSSNGANSSAPISSDHSNSMRKQGQSATRRSISSQSYPNPARIGNHTQPPPNRALSGGNNSRAESPYGRRPADHRMPMSSSRNSPPRREGNSNSRSGSQVVNINDINAGMAGGAGAAIPSSASVGSAGRTTIPSSSNSVSSYNNSHQSEEWKVRIKHKQQRLLLLYHSSKCTYEDGKCPTTQHCGDMKRLWAHMARCSDPECPYPHCFSSRSILSHYRKCKDSRCPACGPVRDSVKNGRISGSGRRQGAGSSNSRGMFPNQPSPTNTVPPQPPQDGRNRDSTSSQNSAISPAVQSAYVPSGLPSGSNYPLHPPPQPQSSSARASDRSRGPASSSAASTGSSRSRSQQAAEIDGRIKHKQQRLLLLRHASKCKAEEGKCTTTPHCAEMKKLWKHISGCQDKDCPVPHCYSSRAVLSHYRRCKDVNCQACAPVRGNVPKKEPETCVPIPPVESSRGIKRPRPNPEPSVPGIPGPVTAPSSVVATQTIPPKKVEATPRSEESSSTLINSLTIEQIETHIQSLNRKNQLPLKYLKEKCSAIIKTLSEHEHWWVFCEPVDPVALNLPDYANIIKKPMDLGTVQKKVEAGQYHSIEDFSADVHLTFDNAMTYNEQGSVVHDMAIAVKKVFTKLNQELIEKIEKEEEERRKNDKACSLCGIEKLQFEPPVFFCNGLNCVSKRIHRNRHFYVGGNNQYFWCNQCYNELDDKLKIELPDLSVTKTELKKKKNDEQHEENWVECDDCKKWVHQICGLFNSRQNKENSKYSCPTCLLKDMKAGTNKTKTNLANAEELPRTKLSEWLEHSVRSRVVDEYKRLAEEKAETEKISFEEAYKVIRNGGNVTIRQVASTDRKLEVKERMKRRYAHKNYPDEFPYRCKCILVFQNLDGVDVILFALYLYEHNEQNPRPNQRTVYISYLDSVHFMRPRALRTFVYHEILISYLDYARRRGFASAHIWACPPLKGDDYIFYAKPEDQKTPKDSRLRQWYIDMLEECQKREIVGEVTNMYDLYFSNKSLDATDVPYLEGDYFCGEAENIIKNLEDGKGGKGGSSGKKSKKKKNSSSNNAKAKSKAKNGRKGTRSGGMDESGDVDDSTSKANGPLVERDPVMAELGNIIKPMKDSFIVAFLNWEGAKPEQLEVPDIIKEAREARKKEESSSGGNPKKRDSDGVSREVTLESMAQRDVRDSKGNPVKVVDDDLEELDCEILNNRQLFLNLCRGNHYQFDHLRRAKHTSMMVLWHLHNPDASKFVQSCACCGKEILSGMRYTCNTCTDYDLCEDCYKNPHANRGTCTHQLVAKPVEGGNSQTNQLTEAQSKERKRNIRLHIQLLEHASVCNSPTCTSSNCAKMKDYLKHSRQCKIKMAGGCKICKRIWTLLRYHAHNCKLKNCTIPHCMGIRERLRQLAKQQQAMDDRRRQVMNRQYRMGGMS